MNLKVSRAARTGRQRFDDLSGVNPCEDGEAVLRDRPVEVCRAGAAVRELSARPKETS